jgi:hypothetical protein
MLRLPRPPPALLLLLRLLLLLLGMLGLLPTA